MHVNHRTIALALLSASFTTAPNASAASGIEQIVVTGLRTELSTFETPAAISVITHDDIASSGAQNIAEVLQGHAGLQIRDTIGDGGRGIVVSMRGFGENAVNNTLVLVDGRRLNNPSMEAPDLGSISLVDIERIEILQGGGGVLFGDQAVGGVLNIITRRPDHPTVDVRLGGGSHDARRLTLSASQRFANGIGARLSAERRESDNYRDNNAADYRSANLLLDYEWSAGRVFAEIQRIDDDLQLPGALPAAMAHHNRRQSLNTGDFSDMETTTSRIGGSYALTPVWSLDMELTRRDSDGHGYQFAPNRSDTRISSFNPRVVGRFEHSGGTAVFTAGVDATNAEYLLEIPDFFFRTDIRQEQRDAYAQLLYPLGDTVQASVGARRSRVEDRNRVSGTRHDDAKTISTASIAWQFRPDARVLLRRDEVLRFANVDENGFVLPSVSFLKPQTGTSWEGGIEWFGPQTSARAMLFDLELDDELLYDPAALGPGAAWGMLGANINLKSSRRRGALLEWRWQVLEQLSLGGNYTLTDAELTSGNAKGKDVPYVARNSGALNATWEIGHGFSAYAEMVYTGSRYALGDDLNAFARVDSERLVNAALRWKAAQWNATLRVNNLGNQKYDTLTSEWYDPALGTAVHSRSVYPAARRTVYLSIGYSL